MDHDREPAGLAGQQHAAENQSLGKVEQFGGLRGGME
jgi:hypothetical protein